MLFPKKTEQFSTFLRGNISAASFGLDLSETELVFEIFLLMKTKIDRLRTFTPAVIQANCKFASALALCIQFSFSHSVFVGETLEQCKAING